MNIDLAKRLVRVELAIDVLEARLKKFKSEKEKLAKYAVLDQFLQDGVRSVKIEEHTLYLHTQRLAASSMPQAELCEAFRIAGLGDLVKTVVNPQTLQAYCRGEFDEGRELPKSVAAVVKVTEITSVRVRKS